MQDRKIPWPRWKDIQEKERAMQKSAMEKSDVRGASKQDVVDARLRAANTEFIAAKERSRPSVLYRPSLSVDGDQYCALYGEDLAQGCAGFGETAESAMADFDRNWASRPPSDLMSKKLEEVVRSFPKRDLVNAKGEPIDHLGKAGDFVHFDDKTYSSMAAAAADGAIAAEVERLRDAVRTLLADVSWLLVRANPGYPKEHATFETIKGRHRALLAELLGEDPT